MAKNVWKLSYVSFQLMAEYPDTAYFDVLRAYHRRQFYKSTGHRRNGFSGYIYDRAEPEDFYSRAGNATNRQECTVIGFHAKYCFHCIVVCQTIKR